MRHLTTLAVTVALLCATAQAAQAHCEIPCGIYGDRMRIQMIEEDIETIEKSMREIRKLSKAPGRNANQLVRWITNKEHHATKIQDVVWQYFMAQRITPESKGQAQEKYRREITLLHEMIIEAMKCKQTTDQKHVRTLRTLTTRFAQSYFGKQKHEH